MNKQEKLIRLSSIVIRLDVLQGHLRWKATDLSRLSKISRSVIYETLGANKKAMFFTALKTLLDEVYWLSPESRVLRNEIDGFSVFMRSRKYILESPELLSLYFRRREGDDEVGQLLRDYEKRFMTEISEITGIKDKSKLILARAFLHGLSIAPFIDDEQTRSCMNQFFELLNSG